MPFFGDLLRMIGQQGPIAWDAARQLAVSIATGGESEANVDPVERMSLEQLARVAELQVTSVTGLSTSVAGQPVQVDPVGRSQWALSTLEAWEPLFTHLADSLSTRQGEVGPDEAGPDPLHPALPDDENASPTDMLDGMMRALSPVLLGMIAGSMVGHQARRSFGQYELPLPRQASHRVMVVPASIAGFAAEWSLDQEGLRLWVCLHELTHQAVLNVAHVRDRLETLLTEYASGFKADPDALERRMSNLDPTQLEAGAGLEAIFGDPEALLGAVQSERQRQLIPQLDAIVAVIVGYVDHVMDRIGTSLVSEYGRITEAMRRRRVETGDADRFVERLFGLTLTQERYDRAAAFIDGVVERGGFDALEPLWRDERFLPTPAEVDAPGLWLARIEI